MNLTHLSAADQDQLRELLARIRNGATHGVSDSDDLSRQLRRAADLLQHAPADSPNGRLRDALIEADQALARRDRRAVITLLRDITSSAGVTVDHARPQSHLQSASAPLVSDAQDRDARLPAGPDSVQRRLTSVAMIGEMVRDRRQAMKLNQQDFADLAGVGRRFISELEQGKPSLEIAKVIAVCAAAGIDLFGAAR